MKLEWITSEDLLSRRKVGRIPFHEKLTLIDGKEKDALVIMRAIQKGLGSFRGLVASTPGKIELSLNMKGAKGERENVIWAMETENAWHDEDADEYPDTPLLVAWEMLERKSLNQHEEAEKIFERTGDTVYIKGLGKLNKRQRDKTMLFLYAFDPLVNLYTLEFRKLHIIHNNYAAYLQSTSIFYEKEMQRARNWIASSRSIQYWAFSHLPILLQIDLLREEFPDRYEIMMKFIHRIYPQISSLESRKGENRQNHVLYARIQDQWFSILNLPVSMQQVICYGAVIASAPEESILVVEKLGDTMDLETMKKLIEALIEDSGSLQIISMVCDERIRDELDKQYLVPVVMEDNIINTIEQAAIHHEELLAIEKEMKKKASLWYKMTHPKKRR